MPLYKASTTTDWISYTPTGAWNTNVSYSGWYRRVGDSLQTTVRIAVSGAPNNATLTVNLPTGLSIDTNKLSTDTDNYTLGTGNILDSGTNRPGPLLVGYNNTTSVAIAYASETASYTILVGIGISVPITFAAGDEIYIQYTVPISGWTA